MGNYYNQYRIAMLPKIEIDGLYQLVLAMLGVGGLRAFKKLKVYRENRL